MALDIDHWRNESEQRALQRFLEEQRMAQYENAQMDERYRFKPWDPWNKPGAGAPLSDSNKRRRGWGLSSNNYDPLPPDKHKVSISETFLDSSRRETKNNTSRSEKLFGGDEKAPGFLDKFGLPGSGAPLRTDSGKVITGKYQHDDLIMQANIVGKKTFLNAIPPIHRDPQKVHQYKHELDEQHFAKVLRMDNERKREMALAQQTGGAYEFGSTDRAKAEDPLASHRARPRPHLTPEQVEAYDPWGKGVPERDVNGYLLHRHKHSQMQNGQLRLLGAAEESGEHQKALERAQQKRDKAFNVITDQNGEHVYDMAVVEKFKPYDPFGKPGAGAPRRDEFGNVLTKIPRPDAEDPVVLKQRDWSNKVYLNEIKQAIKEHQVTKQEWAQLDRADCDNFAEIVDRSRVGKVRRNPVTGFIEGTPLVSTDITKPEVADFQPEIETQLRHRYHNELSKQVEDRGRRIVINQIREQQEARQHYDTQNAFWGRRGVGVAPSKGAMNAKAKLSDTYSSNIYEVFYNNGMMDDYTPRKSYDPKTSKHATSATIRRYNSDGNLAGSPDPIGKLAPYQTDSLYVPGGGLGHYGQELLSSFQNNNDQPQRSSYLSALGTSNGEYFKRPVPEYGTVHQEPRHVFHDSSLGALSFVPLDQPIKQHGGGGGGNKGPNSHPNSQPSHPGAQQQPHNASQAAHHSNQQPTHHQNQPVPHPNQQSHHQPSQAGHHGNQQTVHHQNQPVHPPSKPAPSHPNQAAHHTNQQTAHHPSQPVRPANHQAPAPRHK